MDLVCYSVLELECLGKLADYHEKSIYRVVRRSLVCGGLKTNFRLLRLPHTWHNFEKS